LQLGLPQEVKGKKKKSSPVASPTERRRQKKTKRRFDPAWWGTQYRGLEWGGKEKWQNAKKGSGMKVRRIPSKHFSRGPGVKGYDKREKSKAPNPQLLTHRFGEWPFEE